MSDDHRISRIHYRDRPLAVHGRARLGFSGHIRAVKWDKDGKRVPVRIDRNKRVWQRIWDHHQDNLILNTGLDFLAGSAGGSFLSGSAMLNFIGVGTGSTEPEVTDTALQSELARSNATLGLGTDGVFEHPSVGLQRVTRFRAFDFNDALGNLAEFGGANGAASSMLTRELFRDEFGDPVPITKTDEHQFGIYYGCEGSFGPTSMTAVAPITIVGAGPDPDLEPDLDIELEHMFYRGFDTVSNQAWILGFSLGQGGLTPLTAIGTTYDVANGGFSSPVGIETGSGAGVPTGSEALAYEGGSYERAFRNTYGAQASGADIVGFGFRRRGTAASPNQLFDLCAWRFDDPAVLNKAFDHRLITNAVLEVARA